jgi:alcohol dehydrogenase (cytochrome c)
MNHRRSSTAGLLIAAAVSAVVSAQKISSGELLQGLRNPQRWLSYGGDYTGQRYSPLKQITVANAAQLTALWTYQTGVPGKFEASAIVVDGIIFVSGWDNNAWAVDARSGREIWNYRRQLPINLAICCGSVNRGLAIHGDRLFMSTLDARLVALDMKTGSVVFDVEIDDYRKGYSSTPAPLIVKDKVIVGHAGADYALRGFLDAYDASTGARIWRFWTVPERGEPGGETWPAEAKIRSGGATWKTGSYDPLLNLIYWGTGNPGPSLNGADRQGDNLYTSSIVALDADTGKLRWHFQFTPHDTHDWDSAQMPVLADLTLNGRPRKVVMVANRNGFFYVLDRATGEFLLGRPFVKTTWAESLASTGRPNVLPGTDPNDKGSLVCPGPLGGTNFNSPSYSPSTGLFYLMTRQDTCVTYFAWKQDPQFGQLFLGGGFGGDAGGGGFGALVAIDPVSGLPKWNFRLISPSWGGVLSTAGGLVFSGDNEGNAIALDASTGKLLWRHQTGAAIYAPPTTYMVDDRQQVLIPSGMTLTAFALPSPPAPRAAEPARQ